MLSLVLSFSICLGLDGRTNRSINNIEFFLSKNLYLLCSSLWASAGTLSRVCFSAVKVSHLMLSSGDRCFTT
jgi:hypothetical protein